MTRVGFVARQVALVQCHDNRHPGRLDVADGLFRLGHDSVIGRDDQHGDVGDIGTPCPHVGERCVARRIHESDGSPVLFNLVRANMLGDTAGLAGDESRADQIIEQRRLAVVDMAKKRDDWRTGYQLIRVVFPLLDFRDQCVLECRLLLQFQFDAEFGGQHFDQSAADGGVDRQRLAHADQRLHDACRGDSGCLGETADGTGQFQCRLSLARRGGIGAAMDQGTPFLRCGGFPIGLDGTGGFGLSSGPPCLSLGPRTGHAGQFGMLGSNNRGAVPASSSPRSFGRLSRDRLLARAFRPFAFGTFTREVFQRRSTLTLAGGQRLFGQTDLRLLGLRFGRRRLRCRLFYLRHRRDVDHLASDASACVRRWSLFWVWPPRLPPARLSREMISSREACRTSGATREEAAAGWVGDSSVAAAASGDSGGAAGTVSLVCGAV